MTKRDLIGALDGRLLNSLTRFPQDVQGWVLPLPKPLKLAQRAQQLSTQFDEGAPATPPSQARIEALGRLRDARVDLTRKDWHLISWGLCDDCGLAALPLETDSMFNKVMHYVDAEALKGMSRKVWFGLLHSYFAYPQEAPHLHANWGVLRGKLAATLPALLRHQKREKAWATALENHVELLTADAGKALGKAFLNRDIDVAQEIATYLPIPATSWLWRSVIHAQLALLETSGDDDFLGMIDTMLELALTHPRYLDMILSSVLTRYAKSGHREVPHLELKQFALDQWQNPQINSANRWTSVTEDVRRMVLKWFAQADLEQFFSLLQGEGGVDRPRLLYWLRFVDQITYTRIVMGGDAFSNRSADFADFRTKNKGRFSQLISGDGANNAFVMRIGNYYFVEFSGKGNACYIYSSSNLPFDPETRTFQLLNLKSKLAAIDRILHLSDWQNKADIQLRRLGILPYIYTTQKHQTHLTIAQVETASKKPKNLVLDNSPKVLTPPLVTSKTKPDSSLEKSRSPAQKKQIKNQPDSLNAIFAAMALARNFNLEIEDHRAIGGAFWVRNRAVTENLAKILTDSGFQHFESRGYWIK